MFDLSLEILLGRVIGLVVGFTLHEWAHAWSAYRLGDNTAAYQGRLTIDPRAHIEPVGIVLALVAGFGWAKPVPVNPRAFYPDEKRGMMIVSLAGPVMNVLIALSVGVIIRAMAAGGLLESEARILLSSGEVIAKGIGSVGALTFVYNVLGTVVFFNLVLALFNLLPFSPLDGYKVALGLLPPQHAATLARVERETTLALMLLLFAGVMTAGGFNPLWAILGPPLTALYELFTGFYPVF